MNSKIGFIGCGNMGRAMVGALLNGDPADRPELIVSVKSEKSKKELEEKFKILVTLDNEEVVKSASILFLAVTPNLYETVISEIAPFVTEDHVIVSIAAGISIEQMEKWFSKKVKIMQSMPNTPVMANEGMSAICPNDQVTDAELSEVCSLFRMFGQFEVIGEELFPAFIAVAGSSPAYFFMMIEAMADAAVKLGMPRKLAYRVAEQSMLGSAKLAMETEEHPGSLKDAVCSPGGATIDAVVELERLGFRHAVMSAMDVCAKKSINMD
ncbi:pyrroline-5-carboxylate reductase [Bacillus testis]|uniref:pyrroline-5-carboxylate reductase n=1 Tax=Bacillus testis TaxID=1622072 RepID=UPI00067F5A45|nr:pyrroline-5-carboxylate reductase [Bacillus testis]